MSFLSEIGNDCREMEIDLGNKTMTFQGSIYTCAATVPDAGTTLVVGGNEVDVKLLLRVRKSDANWSFDTIPVAGQTLTYEGTVYRIGSVINAHSAFIEMMLTDKNR